MCMYLAQEPKLSAQYYDDRLRQEMRRLTGLAGTKADITANQSHILGAGSQGAATYHAANIHSVCDCVQFTK